MKPHWFHQAINDFLDNTPKTQRALCREWNITTSTLQNWRNGRTMPSYEKMSEICARMGITPPGEGTDIKQLREAGADAPYPPCPGCDDTVRMVEIDRANYVVRPIIKSSAIPDGVRVIFQTPLRPPEVGILRWIGDNETRFRVVHPVNSPTLWTIAPDGDGSTLWVHGVVVGVRGLYF